MEIPIKNTFLSKAIKKDKTFCNQFSKSKKFITLSPKSESSFSQNRDFKTNFDNSSIVPKTKEKSKLLKTYKNFSDIYSIIPKKSIYIDNSSYIKINKFSNHINYNMNLLPKLIINNKKFEVLNNKIKINMNPNTISTERRNFNLLINKKQEAFNTYKSSILLRNNSDKNNNSFIIDKNELYNIKILPLTNKFNINKYLKEFRKNKEVANSPKKLLVKLNSLNTPILKNYFSKILNLKKMKNSNKYENNYLGKKIFIKKMNFDSIT